MGKVGKRERWMDASLYICDMSSSRSLATDTYTVLMAYNPPVVL